MNNSYSQKESGDQIKLREKEYISAKTSNNDVKKAQKMKY